MAVYLPPFPCEFVSDLKNDFSVDLLEKEPTAVSIADTLKKGKAPIFRIRCRSFSVSLFLVQLARTANANGATNRLICTNIILKGP